MKNKLLITSALVALISAGKVYAAEKVISEDIINQTNTQPHNSGALPINYGDNVTINDNINIIGNISTVGSGGGISALNGFTAGNNLNVSNNKSEHKMGGGIYIRLVDDADYANNRLTATNRNVVIGNNVNISNNKSLWPGGGMAIESAEKVSIGNGAVFEANHSNAEGGAIAMWSESRNKLNGAAFDNKTVLDLGQTKFVKNTSGSKGGAIANKNENTVNIAGGSLFDGNEAATDGGAVYNEGTLNVGENTAFLNNKAVSGGAVHNNNGNVTLAVANFANNSATGNGGAIFNDGVSLTGKMLISDSNFVNNEATTSGGAIHNMEKGALSFKGNNVFSGNKAAGSLNDIYNNGQIDVSGTLTLDGGISGTGTTTFAEGSNLNVIVNTTTITNKVVNNGANLGLTFANGYVGGEYTLITNGGTLDNEFNIAQNGIYSITSKSNGVYNISKKSTSEIVASTGANVNQAATLNAFTSGNSGSATFDNIANSINTLMQSSNAADVKAGLDATTALAPETAAMIQSTSTKNANQVFSAVSSRLSGGSIASGSEGMSSGDSIFKRGAIWVQILFNKSKLEDTSKSKGFDADSTGIAMGAEKYINDDVKAGIGYAYTNTDIDGFMRDTDVDTHTAIIYGEYKPANWFVNGIATYGWSDYSEKKNVAGNQVKADYDVDTIGLQAMIGYDMQIKGFNLTPEVGLRYVHISQDGYKDSADQKVGSNSWDILTSVIGAKVNKDFALENGMNLRPEARLAMTYDLMNDDNNSVVTLANGSAYQVYGEALDRFGIEFGAGLTADVNDNVELSVGYEGKFREDYQDHTGLLIAKYKFLP